jgi:hypothetical protein
MASRGSGAAEALIGVDPGTGVVASIALRGADDTVRDAHGCRDQAMARIRRAVGDDLAGVRTSDAPPFARIDYDLSDVKGAGRQRHAHTFLFRDRTCVHVHVSGPEPEPEPEQGDAAQLEAILRSVRMTEDL